MVLVHEMVVDMQVALVLKVLLMVHVLVLLLLL